MNYISVNAVVDDEQHMPRYANEFAAGADLFASDDFFIPAGTTKVVSTGTYVEIPTGFEGQVRSRSGLAAKHSVFVLNSPGTIDSDYRGEIKAVLTNLGKETYRGKKGDRIAQIVFAPVVRVVFNHVDALSETMRSQGGFGSTGM